MSIIRSETFENFKQKHLLCARLQRARIRTKLQRARLRQKKDRSGDPRSAHCCARRTAPLQRHASADVRVQPAWCPSRTQIRHIPLKLTKSWPGVTEEARG